MLEYESTVFEDELPLSKNDSFSFRSKFFLLIIECVILILCHPH